MLTAVTVTRLEKAATDNGFDLERERTVDWLSFGSSQTRMRIWLGAVGESRFLAAASRADVLDGLAGLGAACTDPLPSVAVGAVAVSDIAALHRLLRRAFQLSRTLPDALLHAFEAPRRGCRGRRRRSAWSSSESARTSSEQVSWSTGMAAAR